MTTLEWVVAALAAGLVFLVLRNRSLAVKVRDLTERADELSRRTRDFERRYEQDLEKNRELVRLEIQSAVHQAKKAEDQGPPDPTKDAIIETLKTVFDPEIPVNVYDLGLIYDINAPDEKQVQIKMSLTSESCPSAKEIPADIERKIKAAHPYEEVDIEVVWEPKWGPHMISDEGKQKLGLVQ